MSDKEDDLNGLIKEYLDMNNFKKTSEALVMECKEKGDPFPDEENKKEMLDDKQVELLLEYFNAGAGEKFTKLWESDVMPLADGNSLQLKKLAFFLQIHFAIFPFREAASKEPPSEGEPPDDKSVQAMQGLRTFLESKGKELMEEAECLRLFALPFANNPSQLSSFKDLFQDSWLNKLRSNLQQFLSMHKKETPEAPRLVTLVNSQHKLSKQIENHCLQDCQRRLLETEKGYKGLKRQLLGLKAAYNKLIGVTAELTKALESAVRSENLDLELTLENCMQIFPELFTQVSLIEEDPQVTAGEILRRSFQVGIQELLSPSNHDLDYQHIKNIVSSGTLRSKLLLLQALRWHVTKIGLEDRESVIASYIRNDLLGLSTPTIYTDVVLRHLCPVTKGGRKYKHAGAVQQQVARLINTIASLRAGRDYLACGTQLIEALLALIKHDPNQGEEEGDGGGSGDDPDRNSQLTRDMVIATLQKLSLRHSQRVRMIEDGMIEWLVEFLSGHENMDPYTLEYSTALLMNLCLNAVGKSRCVPLAEKLLGILTELLGSPTRQIVPYINGTLYSLLDVEEINQVAVMMDFKEKLIQQMELSPPDVGRQLNYILQLHTREKVDEKKGGKADDGVDTETEEVDFMEEELDADDPVKAESGELVGEELLNVLFRLSPADVVRTSVVSTFACSEPLTRPTTPRLQDCTTLYPTTPSVASLPGCGDSSEKLFRTFSVPTVPTQSRILTPRQETIAELGYGYESDRCDYISTANGSVILVTCPTPSARSPTSLVDQVHYEEDEGDEEGDEDEDGEGSPASLPQEEDGPPIGVILRGLVGRSREGLSEQRSPRSAVPTPRSGVPSPRSDAPISERMSVKQKHEYKMAFTSRPKIPRTPPGKEH